MGYGLGLQFLNRPASAFDVGQLHQPDQNPDALGIGADGKALVGAVHAAAYIFRLRQKRAAAQTGVTDPLILMRVRGADGHGRHKNDLRVKLAHGFTELFVAEAVAPRGGGGIVCLEITKLHLRIVDGGTAVFHHRVDAVALVQAEVDDGAHVLGKNVAGGAATLDHGGGDSRCYKGECLGPLCTGRGDRVGVPAHMPDEFPERLFGDI